LEKWGNGLALVMEDFAGIYLSDYLDEWLPVLDIVDFFTIAKSLVVILEGLEAHQILHQQLNPHHLLIDPDTQQVKLVDFAAASVVPKTKQIEPNFHLVADNIAYIAPEQTGRIERGIDRRADFYALGILFYQLLTGQLPFVKIEPIELIHCHLAIAPTPIHIIKPNVPQALSALVLKLMAKNPESRYQTVFGLKWDLEKCEEQLSTIGTIASLNLGARDICDRLVIPEKLYGREQELATLLNAYGNVSQGKSSLVLVTGEAGIGKTALIESLRQPILQQQGYFLKGKFDQLQRDRPLGAILDAFTGLIRQLLLESPEELNLWRKKLLVALGVNGRIIGDVIPELITIIGEQPPIAILEASAAQSRFNFTFSKFIGVFANSDRPLVMFLDDLQWADLASLNLIELITIDSDIGSFLLIGAYRDNEVNAAHPLSLKLQQIAHYQSIEYLQLSPLNLLALNSTISDTLTCSEALALPLTELIWQKTQGNPFFARQLLHFWHQQGLIIFNRDAGCWECDLARIKVVAVREDIVEFMAQRLEELPDLTQQVLKIAACMGNQFELTTLAIAYGKSEIDTAIDLRQALQAGLILPVTEVYRFELNQTTPENSPVNLAIDYQFLHDRVQQAAYNLIPEATRINTHWQIGKLLLDRIPVSTREAHVFEIVNHLNRAVTLIQQPQAKKQLSELNLIAGTKAKAATAYDAAFEYLSLGWQLLPANSWQTDYNLTLSLNLARAEAAYLCGDYREMASLVEIILQQAKSLGDRILAHEIRIQSQIARGTPLAAVEIALEVLRTLGYNLPLKPSKFRVLLALMQAKFNLIGKSRESLLNLPLMSDRDILAAGRIMMLAGSSAFSAAVELVPLLSLTGISISVKYGNSGISTYGYSSYSVILCGVLGDIEGGYNFGKLALDLVDKLNVPELKAKNLMLFNNFVRHWKEHLRDGSQSLLEAYTIGLETGDIEFACYSAYMHCYHAYFFGHELQELAEKMQTYGEVIEKFQQETILRLHRVYHQATLNLLGKNDCPWLLQGEIYDETIALPELIAANHRTALFDLYCHKLILSCFFDRDDAVSYADMTEKYLDSAIATPSIPVFHFYDALSRLLIYDRSSKSTKVRFMGKIQHDRQKLQHWAKYAPTNCQHRLYLIQAEIDRVRGNYLQAIKKYDLALKFAEKYEYTNELALFQELAAKFYLTWHKPKLAKSYIIESYYSYARWGAKAKVEDLWQRYATLLSPIINSHPETPTMAFSSSAADSNSLDLKAIIKTYQAISQAIQIDKLLAIFMKAILTNSGAETGYLILGDRQSEHLLVTAKTTNSEPQVEIDSLNLAESKTNLPISAINYVISTLKHLVLAEDLQKSHLMRDPYFINNQPQSILCLPIIAHNGEHSREAKFSDRHKLIGIIYLENKQTKNVFTSDRLEVLNLLCSQVAISLENAHLYENLKRSEAREKEKSERLERNLQQLQQTQQELLAIQQQLKHDAFHDSLTGLSNRAWLLELLERAINVAIRHPDHLYAVLFLDLDRFKTINDSLGHLAGDELLKQVAQRLRLCVRNTDTVSRLGGDEFAILLDELENPDEATVVAQRIQEQFAISFNLNGHEVYAGTSIGITHSTRNYHKPEDILRDADAAMYQAKSRGKRCYVVFEPAMETNAMAKLQLENALRWAIARKEFSLEYQPIISLSTGSLKGFEALLRWNHPTKGVIPPEEFIPIAEETGLVNNIGWWVLQSACRQLKTWREMFPHKQITLNVNFSTVQLKQERILEKLEKVWRENQLPDFVLKLEIPENCILETFTSEAKILMQLKRLGIGLCIDDFGTGYSSLSRLHQFPIDTLKIDRSFVSHLGSHPQHFETIQTIITLAHSLGMDVVAEGVETQKQLERLQKLKCEYLQGYLFSKPVDAATATQLLHQDNFLNN
jgi:diguanylate cyclase (GGDEF)-like protein